MNKRTGSTIFFEPMPVMVSTACTGGKKESEGPLAGWFDQLTHDNQLNRSSWEAAEQQLQKTALETALRKARLQAKDLELLFAGDLLNQCTASSHAARDSRIPYLGLYGACSTMAEGLLLAAMSVSGGFARQAAAITSSHYATAERQYRFPLNYGGQRPPTAQWTVTGSGCAILSTAGSGPKIAAATIGSIVDAGVTDANNMGAAMAQAACDTIRKHLNECSLKPSDYDLIVTGDLGLVGKTMVLELLSPEFPDFPAVYDDCGTMIYNLQTQDVHGGGSGCGCSAVVLCGWLMDRLRKGDLKKLLFCGTGALLSPTSVQQGNSIPGICHAVSILAPEVTEWTM